MTGTPRRVPVTLNSLVSVRLTYEGRAFLHRQFDVHWQTIKAQGKLIAGALPPRYAEPHADDQGRCQFPLWDFAEKFHRLMLAGSEIERYFTDGVQLEIEVDSPVPATDMGIPMSDLRYGVAVDVPKPATSTHYRKKPVVVEARQFHGTASGTDAELAAWAGAEYRHQGDGRPGALLISTLEGVMEAQAGDYVIRGVAGEFYPCRQDIFEATYERAE